MLVVTERRCLSLIFVLSLSRALRPFALPPSRPPSFINLSFFGSLYDFFVAKFAKVKKLFVLHERVVVEELRQSKCMYFEGRTDGRRGTNFNFIL